jgi:hypothetical protein
MIGSVLARRPDGLCNRKSLTGGVSLRVADEFDRATVAPSGR